MSVKYKPADSGNTFDWLEFARSSNWRSVRIFLMGYAMMRIRLLIFVYNLSLEEGFLHLRFVYIRHRNLEQVVIQNNHIR